MKLLLDTSGVTFTATRASEERKDQNGEVKTDRKTGAVLFTTQVMALDKNGGEVINVTTAGVQPVVTVGQTVRLVELEAIPWATNGRNGTAFRATVIEPVSQVKAA